MKLNEQLTIIREALALLVTDKIKEFSDKIINDPIRARLWSDELSKCLRIQSRLLKHTSYDNTVQGG